MNGLTPTLSVSKPHLVDVVDWMKRFANKGKKDLEIRRLVEQVCADLAPGDYASEVLACYYWACQNIRYMRDVHEVEFLKEPRVTLETRSGDCDDIATLLASMLMSCGNPCSFMLAGFTRPYSPSHVFVLVNTPAGTAPLDPVANRLTPEMLNRVTGSTVVPVDDAPPSRAGVGDADIGRPRPGTMIYSVFDYPSGTYHYYEAQALVLPASGWFRKPSGARLKQPEALAVQVPADAQKVGEGKTAKGLVATLETGIGSVTVNTPKGSTNLSLGALGSVEVPSGTFPWVFFAGMAGFVAAKLWGKK